MRGRRYIEAKNPVGAPQGNNNASKQTEQNVPFVDTSEQLANEYKVSHMTIKRDAKFAQSVDLIAEILGDEARQEILTRDAKLNKKDVTALAKIFGRD